MHWEGIRLATTAHSLQQKNLRLPEDFPQRLKRFQEESGLSWSEIARRLEIYHHTVWRWGAGRAQPNYQHREALMELADSLGLGHVFTEQGTTRQ